MNVVELELMAVSKDELIVFQGRSAVELMMILELEPSEKSKEELLVLSLPCPLSKSELLCAVLVLVICDDVA
jgi:hypothetical protein